MVFPENYPDATLQGKAKGIRQVLIERELWGPGMTANQLAVILQVKMLCSTMFTT